MAIAYDTTSSSTTFGVVTSSTWSHTCSGADRRLYVGVQNVDSTDPITSVTYAGTAMTLVAFVPWPGSTVGSAALYKLINPASGANDIVITYNGSKNQQGAWATSFTGAAQTTTDDSYATLSSNGGVYPVMTTTVPVNDSWLVSHLSSSSGAAMTPDAGTTERVEDLTRAIFAWDSNGTVASGSRSLGGSQGSTGPWYRGVIASFGPAPITFVSPLPTYFRV